MYHLSIQELGFILPIAVFLPGGLHAARVASRKGMFIGRFGVAGGVGAAAGGHLIGGGWGD